MMGTNWTKVPNKKIRFTAFAKFSAGPIGFLAATPGTTAFDTLATAFHKLQISLAGYWKSSPDWCPCFCRLIPTPTPRFWTRLLLPRYFTGCPYAGLVYRPQ